MAGMPGLGQKARGPREQKSLCRTWEKTEFGVFCLFGSMFDLCLY